MKIVHVIPSLKLPGGAESFCINLVIALSKLGHDVTIITLYKDVSFYKERLESNNVSYFSLDKSRGLDITNSFKLKKLIQSISPDIVHSHLGTYLSFFVGRVFKIKNVFFFHTIHASLTSEDKGNFINGWLRKKYRKRKLITHIAISHEVKKYFLNLINVGEEIPVIYNGIPIKDFFNDLSFTARKRDFICVANFSSIKNHLGLLESFKRVIQRKPNVTITLVGDGELRSSIENKIIELGLEKNIDLLGKRSDIFGLLSEHKYFILPSFVEGNPISVLEAMAAGLVILVTKNGGPIDIVINQKNGYLLDPFSQEQMSEAILMCLENVELNIQIQKNNLAKVLTYDISETAKQHIALYESKLKL